MEIAAYLVYCAFGAWTMGDEFTRKEIIIGWCYFIACCILAVIVLKIIEMNTSFYIPKDDLYDIFSAVGCVFLTAVLIMAIIPILLIILEPLIIYFI